MTAVVKPVLIYDGDCAFCRLWLDYLERLLDGRIEWLASQKIGHRFPEIGREEFKKSVVLVAADGQVTRGAHAIVQALALAPRHGALYWLYEHVSPFRWIADLSYSWIAAHRDAGYKLTRALFGSEIRPLGYQITESLFVRCLGIIYLFAFASLEPQILGLIGSHGINPVAQVMQAMRNEFSWRALLYVPSVFWFGISDGSLVWACGIGVIASLALIAGGWIGALWQRISALVCFGLYLSLASVGQPFTLFQWDALLIEAGFLAIFAGTPFLVWAYRFLLFRLIFESGVVKLVSDDPNWRNLHALRFHFMTQPLPTPLAWYAYQAPGWLLDSLTFLTLAIELLCPLLLFFPRRVRHVGAGLLIAFQVIILLTGNYAFFNLLTIALCLWAFDDWSFSKLNRILQGSVAIVRDVVVRKTATALLIILMLIGSTQVISLLTPEVGRPVNRMLTLLSPWQIVNSYGLFAIMTTTRPELVFQGSDDKQTWKEYTFKFKPGDLKRPLPLVAPHQPRLDWQLWFAALGGYQENPWVGNLAIRLLQNDPTVLGLLAKSPFDKAPKYIRVSLYDYWFTTPDERKKTGAIWNRRFEHPFLRDISLEVLQSPQ